MRGTSRLLGKSTWLIMITFLISCKKPINTKADLIAYINNPENGLVKTQEVDKIKVELRYKPWQLMQTDQHKWQKQTGQHADSALQKRYFFVLSLSAGDKELLRQLPSDQYSEMVQVLSFRMVPYINITPDQNKPVAPDDCVFQQTYGLAHANQLLLVFDKTKLQSAKHLQIKIKEFGLGMGDLSFQINNNDIHDLPLAALN